MAAIPAADADKWTTLEDAMPSGKLTIVGCLGGMTTEGCCTTHIKRMGCLCHARIESAYLNREISFRPPPIF